MRRVPRQNYQKQIVSHFSCLDHGCCIAPSNLHVLGYTRNTRLIAVDEDRVFGYLSAGGIDRLARCANFRMETVGWPSQVIQNISLVACHIKGKSSKGYLNVKGRTKDKQRCLTKPSNEKKRWATVLTRRTCSPPRLCPPHHPRSPPRHRKLPRRSPCPATSPARLKETVGRSRVQTRQNGGVWPDFGMLSLGGARKLHFIWGARRYLLEMCFCYRYLR